MTPFGLKQAGPSCAGLGLTLVLAACASEPRYPIRNEAPPPPPPVQAAPTPRPPPPPPPRPRDPEIPLGAPSTPVQSSPLPPVGRGGPRAAPQAAPLAAPVSTGGPNGQPSPWVQPASVLDQPGTVTVGRTETLFDVAERVRTPVRALIEINELQPPYNLSPGTVLKVPPPLFYTMGEGDTLFGVARRFNIDPRSLANLNQMQLETAVRRGQRIALPSLARDQGPNAQAVGASPPGSGGPPRPALATARPVRPLVPGATPPATQPLTSLEGGPVAAPAPTDAQVAAAGKGRFSWPVKGDVISTFGPKGPGQRNDGLNIAATSGDAVHAAAGGEVVFAGDLPGFGNLVLLKHQGGFVTAYAHLSKIEVKMRDTVGQGQEVGLAGQTGQVDRPQVHFEIRYAANPRDKARPVDPSLLLPGAG
jgi:murein DD-endopeptidase MepM/ murein hydrolase activator NlpD